jgi:hypothetical protein
LKAKRPNGTLAALALRCRVVGTVRARFATFSSTSSDTKLKIFPRAVALDGRPCLAVLFPPGLLGMAGDTQACRPAGVEHQGFVTIVLRSCRPPVLVFHLLANIVLVLLDKVVEASTR